MITLLSNIYYSFFFFFFTDIIYYIIGKNLEPYLNITDLHKLKLVNRELKNNIYLQKELYLKKQIIGKYLQIWKQNDVYLYFDDTFFPEKLITLFPVIPFKSYYVGGTDYIDGLGAKDLTSPIMIGCDIWKRPFISIRYKYYIKKKECNGFITVFQRYTDTKKTWVKCRYAGPLMLHDGNSTFTSEDKQLFIANIAKLLCGKKIIVNNYQTTVSDESSWFYNKSFREVYCKLY